MFLTISGEDGPDNVFSKTVNMMATMIPPI